MPIAPFQARIAVRFQDVDHAGILFFAKVLEYCHEAFEDFLASRGYPPKHFFDHKGFGAPFVKCDAEFFHPLRHGDTAVIEVQPAGLGRSSIRFQYEVRNQDGVRCAAVKTMQVMTSGELKSMPVPAELRRALEVEAPTEARSPESGT